MKIIRLLSFAVMFVMIFSCRSFHETLIRNTNEMKNKSYAYEIINLSSSDIQYMQNKAQIDVTVTVTQTYSEQRNAFGKLIKSTKQLLTDEGKIIISFDHKNKLTTVVGDIMFGSMDYYEINGSENVKKSGSPLYSNMKQTLLKKYDMAGDVLCQAIAEYKLIEKMNEVGAQAVFMPNYRWIYHYDDMLSDDNKSNENCDDTILKDAQKTVITLKITAAAVNFVK